MGAISRLDHFQRRHPVVGVPVAVFYKYLDDQGAYLAALIAFYAFFSIFPLFLILTSVLGLVLANYPSLQSDIIDAATHQIPVVGTQIRLRTLGGSVEAVAVGVAGAIYGSLAVANAVQNAMNVAWNVRRNHRPDPFKLRLRSLVLLLMLGLFVVGTTLLSQLGAALQETTSRLDYGSELFALAASMLLSGVLFVVISRLGTATDLTVMQVLPGAVLGSILWQVLQYGGQSFVRRYIASAGATEGVFAIVLGLIAWLYISAMALVACLELNVVLARRLYPRALLTPMTDRVDLTAADQRAYAHLVQTQSLKGFQNIDVTFENDGQNATARRAKLDAAHAPVGKAASPAQETHDVPERAPSPEVLDVLAPEEAAHGAHVAPVPTVPREETPPAPRPSRPGRRRLRR